MREFVHTEAAKAFDGDQDILVQQVSNNAFEKTMVNANNERARSGARTMPFSLSEYTAKQPLLNIAVPVHNSKWNAANYEPLVAVTPNVNDESRVKFIKAFDSKGKVHWLDGRKAPDKPVVLVGLNERVQMDATGQMKVKQNLLSVGKPRKLTPSELAPMNYEEDLPYEGGGGGTGGGGGGPSGVCYFPIGPWLQIPRMECNDISVVESWDRGLPEMCFTMVAGDKNAMLSNQVYIKRVAPMPEEPAWRQPSTWFVPRSAWNCTSTIDVAQWTPAVGDIMAFKFWEQDNGGDDTKIDFTVKVKLASIFEAGVKIPLTLANGDDDVGDIILYRCDYPPRYNNGRMLHVIQKEMSNFWIFFRSA